MCIRDSSITLLNTLLDYSEPGVLGVFTDEKTVARMEHHMEAKGFLEASDMRTAFDMLAWNSDSTRLPAAMHSFYLRSLYLHNQLAKGEMELAGQHLSLKEIK